MKIYLVGGAVRDKLLGYPHHERDWVVVGARPNELEAKGFVPVGKDFPVFLHPETKEEYALARTERKTGSGYTGFLNAEIRESLCRREQIQRLSRISASRDQRRICSGAHRTKNRVRLHRVSVSQRTGCDTGRRSAPPRPDHQRHGRRRARTVGGPLRRP